jgi:hypothetical protein
LTPTETAGILTPDHSVALSPPPRLAAMLQIPVHDLRRIVASLEALTMRGEWGG